MTFLQAVNRVLRRLREDEVTSVADNALSKLVGDFINEAKRQVEDSWNWVQLRNTIQITTVADTYAYTLTGAGRRFRILRDRTNNGWDVFDDTNDGQLQKAPGSAYMTRLFNSNNAQTGIPFWFDINGSSSGDPIVNLWPIPNGAYNINFNMVVPQDDFAIDGTDDATVIAVPEWPVIWGAIALAIAERGEDGGMTFNEADAKAMAALSDAIAIDSANVDEELIWSGE